MRACVSRFSFNEKSTVPSRLVAGTGRRFCKCRFIKSSCHSQKGMYNNLDCDGSIDVLQGIPTLACADSIGQAVDADGDGIVKIFLLVLPVCRMFRTYLAFSAPSVSMVMTDCLDSAENGSARPISSTTRLTRSRVVAFISSPFSNQAK